MATTEAAPSNSIASHAAQFDGDNDVLEAQSDDTASDRDSTHGSEYDESSYTASLASSITAYQYEHGRRYHAYQAGEDQAHISKRHPMR